MAPICYRDGFIQQQIQTRQGMYYTQRSTASDLIFTQSVADPSS